MSRLIKKYKNRRLYDTQTSQYITIEELRHYVIDGIEFRVEDSKNSADLTSAVLLQIFVEMEASATQLLSPVMLRQLILWAHHPMNQQFKSMLEQVFQALEKPVVTNWTKSWEETMAAMLKQWQP